MIASTARLICARRALAAEQDSDLIQDTYAHLFTDADTRTTAIETDAPVHGVLVRNRFYQDVLRSSEPEQVLNLGAGFDTNFQRHSPFHNINYVEVDVPEMVAFKREALESEGALLPAMLAREVTSIEDVNDILKKLDPKLRTTVVAEGFFMYLKKNLFQETLRALIDHLDTRPTLAFDFLDQRVEHDPHHTGVRDRLAAKGEVFQWYALASEIEHLLLGMGYQNTAFWDRNRMCRLYTGADFPGKPFGTISCVTEP